MPPPVAADLEHVLVAVRIRPLNDAEVASKVKTAWRIAQNGVLCFVQQDGTHTVPKYAYDHVFEGITSNEEVHAGVVAPMVAEALQGKNATFFAYGQTGSGKTHTMDAMMDLTASQIFATIDSTPEREFLLKLSAVEVYNEAVHDLLRHPTDHNREPLDLREDAKRKIIVKSLIEEDIPSARHLRSVLRLIGRNREVRVLQAPRLASAASAACSP